MAEPHAGRRAGAVRLPPVVRSLGVVSFLNDLASEMVYPLLPAFLTGRLGAGALALGALDGIADAAAAGVKLGAGWLSDHRAWRRPLIVGGYLIAALTRPLMGLAGAAWHVIALRATDRLGKGARNPPRDAVIADAAPLALRGRAFGYHRGMDHAGAAVGPLVASALLAGFALSPRDVILWSVVPGLAAVGVVALTLRRFLPEREASAPPARPTPARTPPPRALIAAIMVFAFARLPETLFILRLQDVGVHVALVPVLWSLLHVVRTAGSYPGGWLSDRVGPARTMVLGWLVYATVCAGLATTASPLAVAAWFVAFGLVATVTESPERALVAAWGGHAARGRRFGMYHAGIGLAALPGGLVLGAVYQWRGGPTALLASGAVALGLGVVGALVSGKGTPGPPARVAA